MARVSNVVLKERAFRPLIRAVRRVAVKAAPCPYCGSDEVRWSMRRSWTDFALACLLLAPFRCRKCQWRFFRVWRPALRRVPEPPRSPVLMMPRQVLEIDPVQPYSVEPIQIETTPPEPALPHLVELPPSLVPPVRLIRPRSILILESDLSISKLLRRLLDRRGYFTYEVSKPGDLASELSERRVDLLVIDASPLSSAFGLAELHPNLKILALSLESPDPAGIPARCSALTKPFSLESFIESVDRLLEPAAG